MDIAPISISCGVSGDDEKKSIDDNLLKNMSDEVYFRHLPPGYIFNPTDQELIVEYLDKKVRNQRLPRNKIKCVNLYDYNPQTLCEEYKDYCGNKEWYFFTPRNRKYKNGQRPNRAAGDGYWKATGADKDILECESNRKVGCRKALVFYKGRPPSGDKTPWIMHEYKVENGPECDRSVDAMRLDDWVLCRIYNKNDKFNSKNNNNNNPSSSDKGKQKVDEEEEHEEEVDNNVENNDEDDNDDVPENICGGSNTNTPISDNDHQNHLQISSYDRHPPHATATAPPSHMWNQLLPPQTTNTNIIHYHHHQQQQEDNNDLINQHNNPYAFLDSYCHLENTTTTTTFQAAQVQVAPAPHNPQAPQANLLPYHQYQNWQRQAPYPSFNGNHHPYYLHYNSDLLEAPHPTINGNTHHHNNYLQALQPSTTLQPQTAAAADDDFEEEYDTDQFLA